MVKIISSKVAVRKTIKAQLQKEIPQINDAIEEATAKGETIIEEYDGDISKPTRNMLEKAGYVVECWNMLQVKPRISWHHSYHDCSDNDSELKKIAKELDLKIVEIQ